MNNEKAINLGVLNALKEGLNVVFDRPFEVDLLNNDSFKEKASRPA